MHTVYEVIASDGTHFRCTVVKVGGPGTWYSWRWLISSGTTEYVGPVAERPSGYSREHVTEVVNAWWAVRKSTRARRAPEAFA